MIETKNLPPDSLLAAFNRDKGGFSDCFCLRISGVVSLPDYMRAFYTTRLFRAERTLLRLAKLGGSDEQLNRLLSGDGAEFAAWTLWRRTETQALMRQVNGPTASWFAAEPDGDATVLCFGSAVIPTRPDGSFGRLFHWVTPLHTLYSRALLRAAANALHKR